MELAMAPRVLPSLPQSRLLIPRPNLARSLRFRAKPGLVRSSSSSGSDFWSSVDAKEESAKVAVAEKKEEAPLEKEKEVKEKVSVVAEVKEDASSGELSEEKSPASDLLKELNFDWESADKSKLLVYGSGALVALWVSSVVVSAVDSIPLFPKLMEVVGLGYSVWFTWRYLLFKDNREEFFGKISELKDQILGSGDE
ncbi:CURVATURE THYLAKOID protein [Rhynchospora pubera]|uniref:CURVATURE THYLAKOID protein n=1 Tax=Rhynchospora pubera TaxID=906938 RepID=A0AAV8CBJ2_9POAL|nr:CURVATURE THYLAKOID protein [Rhynchospora pubera]